MSSLPERTFAIIAEQLRVPVDQVTPQAHLTDDLNADSLDLVDLTIAIEEEFSTDDNELEISEDDAAELHTVQDVIDFLAARGVT
ncbi:MAG TPA: acyl carrier protein [Dehalococcoidia bacterium]|nr:acyl carrier protein [Dehalococcoidia bacterium]